MKVTVNGGTLPQAEIDAYVEQIKAENPDKYIKSFDFTVNGEDIDVKYDYDVVPFERIRRITGYLVGTVDRFNNAKRAEVEDRVKHSLGDCSACSIEDIA
ncbi:MAG: anaerobic ribonucleoside-triphosphate reductase [Ruminococcus sp.]